MPTRKIIEIDESRCNGCGQCVTGCAEGALAIVDGKARLVRETYCDGFGDCIGTCPTGALKIVERDSAPFDPAATREYLRQTQGEDAVRRMDAAAVRHDSSSGSKHADDGSPSKSATEKKLSFRSGCPGTRMRTFAPPAGAAVASVPSENGLPGKINQSELRQWPVQLHLVPPDAPWFKNRELVLLSTCAPIASADVHWRFLRGRSVVVACPKLDRTEPYVEKLQGIFSEPSIPRVLVVRMEVPCCGGLTQLAQTAARQCGRDDLVVQEVVVSLDGDVQ